MWTDLSRVVDAIFMYPSGRVGRVHVYPSGLEGDELVMLGPQGGGKKAAIDVTWVRWFAPSIGEECIQ